MQMTVRSCSLGVFPDYYLEASGTHATSIATLFRQTPGLLCEWDREGVREYLARKPDGHRTCFSGIRQLPAGTELCHGIEGYRIEPIRRSRKSSGTLLSVLEQAVAKILHPGRKVALALSGGLDSALILAIALRVAHEPFEVCTLATHWTGYCELETTLKTARLFGISNVTVIEADPSAFVSGLPDAIAACETPLFNLHPVSKWLLARALQKRGIEVLLTGDGADQVFAGSDGRNYLPIAGAMVRAAGLKLASPFWDDEMLDWMSNQTPDPNKQLLRNAACKVLPEMLSTQVKVPRFAPEFDLAAYRCAKTDTHLSRLLGVPIPDTSAGPENTLWATLALLWQQMERLR